ncbi:MAG: hypothetical protein P1T08_17565 [Acidimicrobiia bacterium]|nr:hypothetical protein [Acidimicrobiia bacterium]
MGGRFPTVSVTATDSICGGAGDPSGDSGGTEEDTDGDGEPIGSLIEAAPFFEDGQRFDFEIGLALSLRVVVSPDARDSYDRSSGVIAARIIERVGQGSGHPYPDALVGSDRRATLDYRLVDVYIAIQLCPCPAVVAMAVIAYQLT